RGIQDRDRPNLSSSCHCCSRRSDGYFQLCHHDGSTVEGRSRICNVFCGQMIVGARIEDDAIMTGNVHYDESHSRRNAACALDVRDINSLLAIEGKRHLAEAVVANSGYEADFRTEPCTSYGLVRALPTIVHAISSSEKRFSASRQALDSHGETGSVASCNRDVRSSQIKSSNVRPSR